MKTILITGSTDGIGKGTALKLAKEGHHIYIHGRNKDKLNRVILELQYASNNQYIKGFVADFSDLNAVKQMAEKINKEVPKLDVLVNNAGIYKSKIEKTKAGLDIRMAVNYFAPVILTENILPVLEKGKEVRILNLCSAAQSAVQKDVLTGDTSINANGAYAQSKLALTMWTFNFAKQHPNIATIAVNPGSLLNTKMVKETFGQYWSPAEKGVDILYSLALDVIHANKSGHYFDNDMGSYNNAHPDAYDLTKISALMNSTNELLIAI